ncbi:MAG: hypothetical protein ACRDJU_09370 [Actinomycetota bacterium]
MAGDSSRGVEWAIRRVEARRPDLGRAAQSMADQLTAGEGAVFIHQALVQETLWWFVPRNCPEGQWQEYLDAAGELLAELGMDRLAGIAASPQTKTVLAAWAVDERQGAAAFRKARQDSGVAAPDTPLLVWGSFTGIDESTARQDIERALSKAIDRGELVPGASGWRRKAVVIAEAALSAPRDPVLGQSYLSLITTERISSWIDLASPPLRDWRQAVGNRLLNPIDPPADPAAAVAPMVWLLELTSGEGVELTQAGYLPRATFLEASNRFGWWDFDTPPRSEVDVYQVTALREAATHLRLVRRRGRRLRTTARGEQLRKNPVELWRSVAEATEDGDPFTRVVTELVGLQLLMRGRLLWSDIAPAVSPVLRAQGWSAGTHLITDKEVASGVHAPLRYWRLFGLLDEVESMWDREMHRQLTPASIALTPDGEATVWAYLRARATGPRHDFYGAGR